MSEKIIPTAKQFLKLYIKGNELGKYDDCMIEFTKLHVTQALKEASEKAEVEVIEYRDYEVDKESILNAYPLENIK
jgi:hypothetical protein